MRVCVCVCVCVCIVGRLSFWMGHRVTSTAASSKVRAPCVFVSETVWRHSNIFSCCSSCKRVIIIHSVPSVALSVSPVKIISLLTTKFYTLSLFRSILLFLFLKLLNYLPGSFLPLLFSCVCSSSHTSQQRAESAAYEFSPSVSLFEPQSLKV